MPAVPLRPHTPHLHSLLPAVKGGDEVDLGKVCWGKGRGRGEGVRAGAGKAFVREGVYVPGAGVQVQGRAREREGLYLGRCADAGGAREREPVQLTCVQEQGWACVRRGIMCISGEVGAKPPRHGPPLPTTLSQVT